MRMLLHLLFNAIALLALPYVFTSINVDSFGTALIVALVLGIINVLIRLILVLLTLPVTLLTLGLFIFVINGLLVLGRGLVHARLSCQRLLGRFFGAIVYSIISWALASLLPRKH